MIEKIQQANLRILLEVDRICKKHGIKYLLDSGTLIGAVRHKGFIPWDDDIDLAFPRKDYEKFLSVAESELPEGIKLYRPCDIGGGRAFFDFTPKLVYMNSRRHFEDGESRYYDNIQNRICVDLFVLDEITENKLMQKLHILKMYIIYGMAMGHRYRLDYSKYKGLQKLQVFVLATFGKLFRMKTIYKMERRAATHYNNSGSNTLYYSNYEPGYTQITVPKQGSFNTVDMEFEGHMLSAPANYDGVLKAVYGDYMKLPPKEERVPKHCSECDEEHGFFVAFDTVKKG